MICLFSFLAFFFSSTKKENIKNSVCYIDPTVFVFTLVDIYIRVAISSDADILYIPRYELFFVQYVGELICEDLYPIRIPEEKGVFFLPFFLFY